LRRKGFREEQGSRHHKLVLQRQGKDSPVFTFVSYGTSEYGDRLLGVMASRQLHVSKADLLRLIDCPMDYDEYVNHLIHGGQLNP
jgi:hypothetical protein